MLVKFNSKVGNIIMFGDAAVALLRIMGMSGDLPGAVLAADIPAALDLLKRACAAAPEPQPGSNEKEAGSEPRVSMRQRAYPLIRLLTEAAAKDCDVIWEEYTPRLGGVM